MRIIILGTRGFPNVQGGVEKHCEYLSVNLVKLGCEVIVFTRKPYVDENIREFKGVRLIALPTFKHKTLEAFFHTLIGIFAAFRYRPDILHIQAIGPALFTPLARILGMKVVLTSHGSNYKHLKWGKFARIVLRLGELFGVSFANDVISISRQIAREIKQKYNRDPVVIHNGVHIENTIGREDTLGKYGIRKSKYILSVGRFVPEKGFHLLIDAFQELHLDDIKLVVIGRADHAGKYSLVLQTKASKNSNIVLPGFLSGSPLNQLYSHARLFVLPSYYEGSPIVLLEAMRYGLSCVVSDIPAHRELGLCEDRFFEVGDSTALEAKIREFLSKPIPEEEIRKQKNIIDEKYNWRDAAYRTLGVYQRCLKC